MPSKKKHSRAAQLQPQPQPAASDYDTDTAAVTDAVAPAMAPPPARTNTELNLLVLRRYVPETERIISIAPFAVVYLFSSETRQWEKSGVEGTLFVCQLSGSHYPRYNVVILNRKSLDNFITELVSGEDIEITEQYVILQVIGDEGTPNIYGLWIFSEGDSVPSVREVVANAIQECAVRVEMARASLADDEREQYHQPEPYNLDGAHEAVSYGQNSSAVQPAITQNVDLLSLFSKPSLAATQSMPMQSNISENSKTMEPQPPRFIPHADTEALLASHSPATAHRSSQSNALLDLFKSAKNR